MRYEFADDVLRCKSLLIFKEEDEIKNNIIKKEMTNYDQRITVQWNSKTYCNAEVMICHEVTYLGGQLDHKG